MIFTLNIHIVCVAYEAKTQDLSHAILSPFHNLVELHITLALFPIRNRIAFCVIKPLDLWIFLLVFMLSLYCTQCTYCTVQHLLGVSNRVEWFLKNKTTLIMLLQIFLRPRLKIALLKVAFSCIWKIYICFILLYSILSQTWNLPPDVTSEPPFLSCVSARTLLEKFGRFHWLMMITLL